MMFPWHFFRLKDILVNVRLFWDLIKTIMLSWYCLSPWRHFFMNCNACWKFCSKQEVPKTSWNHWANSDTFLIPLFFWVYTGSLFSWIIMNLKRGCRSRGCKCTQLNLFNLLDIHDLQQNFIPHEIFEMTRWRHIFDVEFDLQYTIDEVLPTEIWRSQFLRNTSIGEVTRNFRRVGQFWNRCQVS